MTAPARPASAPRWTGCPCGCMTKLPYVDDPDCVRHRPIVFDYNLYKRRRAAA